MQTASDPFLDWATNFDGQHLVVRHFRDWKGAIDVACLDADGLREYASLCAWTLAKAHARSGDRQAIATLLDRDRGFLELLQERAVGHADWAEQDHALLVAERAAAGADRG